MSPLLAVGITLGAALLGAALTAALIPRLERAQVLDVPNARSLHAAPVPRGGGLAVALTVLPMQLALVATGRLALVPGLALVITGAGFAALGWADDRASRGVALRLALQMLLATGFVTFAPAGDTGVMARALLWLALLWQVNLFNFMDGADGFAGTQALCAALGLAVLLTLAGQPGAALAACALAGAAAGFLRWNWHPARVFLGDVGSYFAGFQLGALAWWSSTGEATPWPALVLLAPFVTDASLTLGARALRGAPVWRAHREHAYQRLVLAGWSPARLARALGLLCVLLCWPAAALARGWPVTASVSAYGLLAIIWAWARRSPPSS